MPSRYLDAQSLFHADEMPEPVPARGASSRWPDTTRGREAPVDVRPAARDWLSAIQYRDLNHYLPLDILTKVDRMTMAHSLEARPPLLDHRLVEFAATIPARFRLRDGTTKYLFKQAMRGILPDCIIDRQKHGFAVPLAHWFRGELAGFARDVLLSDTCRQRGIFDAALRRTAAAAERPRPRSRPAALDDAVLRALVPPLPRSPQPQPAPQAGPRRLLRGNRRPPCSRGLSRCVAERLDRS